MKKLKFLVGVVFCLFTGFVLADDPFEGKIAPQSFQQVGTPPAKVPPPKNLPKTPTKPNEPGTQDIQAQLSQLNQILLLMQQQTDQKIESLTAKDNLFETSLRNFQTVLVLMNREMKDMSAQIQELQKRLPPPTAEASSPHFNFSKWVAELEKKTHFPLRTWIYWALVLIAIIVFAVSFFKKRMKATPAVKAEEEYDFMGSKEGIPAKLDLARAYIAMEDHVAARKVLAEVIEKGDTQQRTDAQDLLNKLPANS